MSDFAGFFATFFNTLHERKESGGNAARCGLQFYKIINIAIQYNDFRLMDVEAVFLYCSKGFFP